MRNIVALIVSPMVTFLPAIAFPSMWGFFALLTIVYAYPITLLVGLPTYYYLRYKGWLGLWQLASAGTLVGVTLPTLIMVALVMESSGDASGAGSIGSILILPLLGATFGAAVAGTFWFIAIAPIRQNP